MHLILCYTFDSDGETGIFHMRRKRKYMQLFSRIPDRFFSILASTNKELYVQAIFVLRQAFKTELVIRREDLASMLMDALEEDFARADFSEEAEELDDYEREAADPADSAGASNLSGKAHLLLRRLKETGWIETEYESNSFEENITIPDYAISVMNLLYDLSTERVKEYNSYVYATYAALENSVENPDYVYQALQTAYQNTVNLIDELKSLFNNIRRYYRRIPGENDINLLLQAHFDEYQTTIVDTVYYPLKTIDSVPRFKHAIIARLNGWLLNEEILNRIVEQGMTRRVFEDELSGRDEMYRMINFVADTYETIEEMLDEIDRKHNEYVNASVEHIRYLMNTDRGAKGKLIELLKHAGSEEVLREMEAGLSVYRHRFFDQKSLYSQVKRTRRAEGPPMAVQEAAVQPELVEGFLGEVRRQYTNQKIDAFMEQCFGDQDVISTEEIPVTDSESFILFLLGTIRGREQRASFTTEFREGSIDVNGYHLPAAVFRKK